MQNCLLNEWTLVGEFKGSKERVILSTKKDYKESQKILKFYALSLYTKKYFELCGKSLNIGDGNFITQQRLLWVVAVGLNELFKPYIVSHIDMKFLTTR